MQTEKLYRHYLQYPVICTDSRQMKPNCLFFCLRGEHFDGNQFAHQALDEGAGYVITENQDLRGQGRYIVVDDCLATLQALARYHREQLKIPVIGITGTNGKTTTKELTAAVLTKKYRVACTQGNLNNHIGVPLTLLSIRPTDDVAIVEMGANHPGEIELLCRLARPSLGVITNIGKAHMEGFGTMAEIIRTKKALYRFVIQQDGTLFVNYRDKILRQDLHYDHIVFYGESGEADIVSQSPYLRIRVANREIDTQLTGSYNIYNFLCAAAIGEYFDVPNKTIVEALSNYRPANHRSQIDKIGDNITISDYYNANPASMEAALHNLDLLKHPHKIAILGDMLELGNISQTEHRHIIELCRQSGIQTYYVGKNFADLLPDRAFPTVNKLNDFLSQHPIHNSLILIKGSHDIHLEQLSLLRHDE